MRGFGVWTGIGGLGKGLGVSERGHMVSEDGWGLGIREGSWRGV